jgi:oligopeptide/dipeptide ABC transporter ATP-binding protein
MSALAGGSGVPLLELRELKKYFPHKGDKFIRAVNNVSLEIGENEILGIVGESGCGKSTLGRLMLRLIKPSSGQVLFKGEDISQFSHRSLAPARRSMQMVFQNPFASFNPKIKISAALMEVCRFYGMSVLQAQERIAALFGDIGLSKDLLIRWPRELSGGQLQRLAIARSLLSDPALIVADEPLSALDVSVQAQLLNLLRNLHKKNAGSIVFISHDMTVVEYLCDRVAVMYLGEIVEMASTKELFGNTLHPYSCSLRAAVPRLETPKLLGHVIPAPSIIKGETPIPRDGMQGCSFANRCPQAMLLCRSETPPIRESTPGHPVRCHRI